MEKSEKINIIGFDKEIGKRDCYIKALKLNNAHAQSWNNLGAELIKRGKIRIPGFKKEFSEKDCFIKAVEYGKLNTDNKNNSTFFNNLGN